ncbi:MAG: type II secretion system protein [Acidobacteria bacterium]|nr:type II secretion system protein [Acidobacteriota bacterium]
MRRSQHSARDESGYVLLAILFALTVLIIGLAVAAPRAAVAVQRTKEDEVIRRGEQYALAIRRFYRKFGRYPSSIDQLENTNNIRFLRRHYLDPLTGKDDWKPIQFGQARPALGFFGQKVMNVGGLSPSGPGLGPSTIGTTLGGSNSSTDSSSSSGTNPPNSSSTGGTNTATGASGTSPTGTAGNPISSDQLGGRTFGGGAIVGVFVPSEKESLKTFQQQTHYKDWQFVYDPTMDPTLRGGAGVGAGTGIPGANGPGLTPGVTPLSPTGTTPTSNPINPNPGTGPGGGVMPTTPH